jgi:pimeloyl-ACP methyl ester carboxylesterase
MPPISLDEAPGDPMKRQFVSTALGQVHIVEAGAGAATPLVLLHQTPRSIDEYAEVLPLLAARRRTIAIDNPGYGCSDMPPREPTLEDYAAVVRDVLKALDTPRAIFIGHHTGAVISVELAAAYPELVERVVLSGPVYVDAAGRAELMPHFVQWHAAADGAHLMEKWTRFRTWGIDTALTQRVLLDLFRAGERSEEGHFAVARYRMEDRIGLVRCPALLLFHANDPFTDPARAAPLAAAFRPSRTVTLPTGVFGANEDPAAFAQAVLDYVDGPP